MTCQNLQNKLLNITLVYLVSVGEFKINVTRQTWRALFHFGEYLFQFTRHFGECLKNMVSHTAKVITVRNTLPYGHAPTYEISLTYLKRQKSSGPDKLRREEAEAEEKIRLKQYVSLRSKGRHNKIVYKKPIK